jgi:hypothetical protein
VPAELKRKLDAVAEGVGLQYAEQLLFMKLLHDINGTDEVGNKILAFIHECVKLNKHNASGDLAERNLPKRCTTIKRNMGRKLREINKSSDIATGRTKIFL